MGSTQACWRTHSRPAWCISAAKNLHSEIWENIRITIIWSICSSLNCFLKFIKGKSCQPFYLFFFNQVRLKRNKSIIKILKTVTCNSFQLKNKLIRPLRTCPYKTDGNDSTHFCGTADFLPLWQRYYHLNQISTVNIQTVNVLCLLRRLGYYHRLASVTLAFQWIREDFWPSGLRTASSILSYRLLHSNTQSTNSSRWCVHTDASTAVWGSLTWLKSKAFGLDFMSSWYGHCTWFFFLLFYLIPGFHNNDSFLIFTSSFKQGQINTGRRQLSTPLCGLWGNQTEAQSIREKHSHSLNPGHRQLTVAWQQGWLTLDQDVVKKLLKRNEQRAHTRWQQELASL